MEKVEGCGVAKSVCAYHRFGEITYVFLRTQAIHQVSGLGVNWGTDVALRLLDCAITVVMLSYDCASVGKICVVGVVGWAMHALNKNTAPCVLSTPGLGCGGLALRVWGFGP